MADNPHTAGKYVIAAALIAVLGSIAVPYIENHLDNSSSLEENKKEIKYEDDEFKSRSVKAETKEREKPLEYNKVPDNEKRLAEQEIKTLLSSFIRHWTNKDLSGLSELLATGFYYGDQDVDYQGREDFLKEKQRLFNKYDWIKIDFSQTDIEFDGNNINTGKVNYYQNYDTKYYHSWGQNSLFFKKINGSYKITKELFKKDGGGPK